jgi:hypothetical protein
MLAFKSNRLVAKPDDGSTQRRRRRSSTLREVFAARSERYFNILPTGWTINRVPLLSPRADDDRAGTNISGTGNYVASWKMIASKQDSLPTKGATSPSCSINNRPVQGT